MKRILLSLLFAGVISSAAAQAPSEGNCTDWNAPNNKEYLFRPFPDTMQLHVPHLYERRYFDQSHMTPMVSMSSLMKIRAKYAMRKIDIIPYQVRSSWFTISNGQAHNWGPYPDSYLDARTLSFPISGR